MLAFSSVRDRDWVCGRFDGLSRGDGVIGLVAATSNRLQSNRGIKWAAEAFGR